MEELIVRNRDELFDLVQTDDGLVFRVVCGRVGLYEFEVRLTAAEEARYRAEGESFLRELAVAVRRKRDEHDRIAKARRSRQ
jgi:hypothetical protein